MPFDLKKLKNKPPENINKNKKWDIRSYKPRKANFPNPSSLKGKSITKDILVIFGEELIKGIKESAKKASGRGLGIPKSENFYDSFSYEITKGGRIKILSSWNWVRKYLMSKSPYQINVFRKPGENKIVPLKTKSGDVIFRQAPLYGTKGWVHPAIARFNFIDEGIKIGERRAIRRALSHFQTTTQ